VNPVTTATSLPEQIDATKLYFTDVTHRSAKLHWEQPDLGNWQWPILGYEIQIADSATFEWTKVPGLTVPGSTPDDSYKGAAPWTTCPAGEDSMPLGQCTGGKLTGLTWEQGAATEQTIVGLAKNTLYYVRMRARNHDGPAAKWSEVSYGLLTHDTPNKMDTPVVYQVTETTMTILFDTPVTTGTNECADISSKIADTVGVYLSGEECTVAGQVGNVKSTDTGYAGTKCAASSTKTCQTLGSGSPVTAYRIMRAVVDPVAGVGSFEELKSATTGLALFGELTTPSSRNSAIKSFSGTEGDWYYTVEDLEADTKYAFKVLATNTAGQNVASDAVTGTTLGVPMQPLPPVATAVGETTITLTWNTAVGYCDANDTVPLSAPAYTRLTKDFPNEPTRTLECPVDSGSPITGFRLFASSYNPGSSYVSDDGLQYNATTSELQAASAWEPARRGSLTTDAGGTAYASNPLVTDLPAGVNDGTWLEINVARASLDQPFTVQHLAQDTYYKFRIIYTNAVGDSPVSVDSTFMLTLEAPVANLKMHSTPPCIYEDSRQPTRFVATSAGTNVFYKWQLPDGVLYNSHNTMSFGSVIAEHGVSSNCKTPDCSVMEFVLPAISTAMNDMGNATMESAGPDDFTMSVIGYNTRGQVMLQTSYKIEYCGCTNPWDRNYWDQATFHLPLMCESETWDGADKTVIEGEFEYYQTFYDEHTHGAQVIVRVDEGAVNLYTSTEGVPDPAMDTTYSSVWLEISSFYVLDIPYSQLVGSNKIYVAIQGATGAAFSRFSVVVSTSEFTRGRGDRYGSQYASQPHRRTQLLNIEPQAFEVKTPYYDFFEYYFGRASNDMDVEIKVNCQMGCVNVYTSKIERFPSALRSHGSYAGYWESHKGTVCAAQNSAFTGVTGGSGQRRQSLFATASFDGDSGVYGMVTFTQMVDAQGVAMDDISIGVSMKGLFGVAGSPITWQINPFAVGTDTAGASCASTGTTAFAALPGSLTMQSDGQTVFTKTYVVGDGSISIEGQSIASASEGGNTTASAGLGTVARQQSIVGRSVVITVPRTQGAPPVTVCATIYPDTQVTSYIGELSLMHTIKPEETVATCISSKDSHGVATGLCSGTTTEERMLFASVQGANSFEVGDEQVNNQYTIEAKVYRYRVESNLLDPQIADVECTVAVDTDAVLPGDFSNSTVACGHASEDRRYSVVSIDNFNYYEVDVSPAAFGITIYFTLHYGQVELYTSDSKLPTQDLKGYDLKFGDVYEADMDRNVSCGYGKLGFSGACAREYVDANGVPQLDLTALHKGSQFQPGSKYRITIPYSSVNVKDKYIFLGVLGKSPDASYEISVTEYLFEDDCKADSTTGDVLSVADGGCNLIDGVSASPTLTAGDYSFFTMYVGPPDEAMEVTKRSYAGRRAGDLGTNVDSWGIDWTEELTTTWVEQQRDEWDLDVNINVDVSGATGPITVYGSTREPYPSDERGYDKKVIMNCGSSVTGPAAALCTNSSFVIPHFTFSDKTVYISMKPVNSESITILPGISEYNNDRISGFTPLPEATCPNGCSGHGSCIVTAQPPPLPDKAVCFCDNGFLGEGCEIEAFCTGTSCAGQPQLGISKATFPAGVSFDGDKAVEVPFTLSSIPANSKVHVYVDGLPYPAKGANVILYSADGCESDPMCTVAQTGSLSTAGKVMVYGMAAGVAHVTELLLLSENNIPLATDMVDFTVKFAGGCANNCQDANGKANGVCHHGYCVCFDGYAGVSCGLKESDYSPAQFEAALKAENFTAGGGFVSYNRALMAQERAEDQYISKLKLDANAASLKTSDTKIKASHDAVVAKLNSFVESNEQKMQELASHQKAEADKLHRKRDRITTTIQQMKEESKRLKTHNQEMYLDTVRSLHEGQRAMQNDLDEKRKDHFVAMAKRHDEWVQIKERNDFKLSQLRTANGPLVNIDDLEERQCEQDDMFRTSCRNVPSSETFKTSAGYRSGQTVKDIGTCSPTSTDYTWQASTSGTRVGYSTLSSTSSPGTCTCSPAATDGAPYTDVTCSTAGHAWVAGGCFEATCVLVQIDGEMQDNLYDSIPR
jgi:hypothetical protein